MWHADVVEQLGQVDWLVAWLLSFFTMIFQYLNFITSNYELAVYVLFYCPVTCVVSKGGIIN